MTVPAQPIQEAQAASVPQNNDEAIGQYARGFLDDLEKNDVPEALDPDAVEEPQETPAEEVQETEAETPTPEPEVPLVEIDIDGEKFTIPEKVKHRVMADKDYRQKTMEVAATKRQLEHLVATAQHVQAQAQQLAPFHAQLLQMDNHAQYLDQQLRSGQLNDDPIQFNRVQSELAILLHQKSQFEQGLSQRVNNLSQQQQQLRAQQLTLDAPKLLEEFPEIAKPETQQKLAKYVMDSGLPPEALDFLNYSAAGTKLAWKAHQYDVMVADQVKAKAKLNEKVKTLPSATQSSRAVDVSAKDKQLHSDWKKNGGKINDPAFSQILRNKLRGK